MRALFNIAYWFVGAAGLSWLAFDRIAAGDLVLGLIALAGDALMGAVFIWPALLASRKATAGPAHGVWRVTHEDPDDLVHPLHSADIQLARDVIERLPAHESRALVVMIRAARSKVFWPGVKHIIDRAEERHLNR